MRRPFLALTCILLLTVPLGACAREKTPKNPALEVRTENPIRALRPLLDILRPDVSDRPSAMYGSFIATFLSQADTIPLESALRGLGMNMKLQETQLLSMDASFAILQELGSVLQTDIQDALNRSPTRPETLTAYITSLRSIGLRAGEEKKAIEASIESLRQKRTIERRELSVIDHEIRRALESQDFARAGSQQKSLSEAQEKLDRTEAELNQREQTLGALRKLLEIAEKRIQAIESNREVLIAGLRVVELPGIEDIGILQGKERGRDIPSIFGPL